MVIDLGSWHSLAPGVPLCGGPHPCLGAAPKYLTCQASWHCNRVGESDNSIRSHRSARQLRSGESDHPMAHGGGDDKSEMDVILGAPKRGARFVAPESDVNWHFVAWDQVGPAPYKSSPWDLAPKP
jgi:hypothetical protein